MFADCWLSQAQNLNSVYQSNLPFAGIKNSIEVNANSEAGTLPECRF